MSVPSALSLPLLLLLGVLAGDGFLGVYLPESGPAIVQSVISDTAAAKAGIRAGDQLIAVGDRETPKVDEFREAIGSHNAGDRVVLRLRRDGTEHTLAVVLGKRPDVVPPPADAEEAEETATETEDAPQEAVAAPVAEEAAAEEAAAEEAAAEEAVAEAAPRGERVRRLMPTARVESGGRPFIGVRVVDGDGAVQIDEVVEGSPAARAGMRDGDAMVGLGRAEIRSTADLEKALAELRPGQVVRVVVRRDGGTRRLPLTLGTAGAPMVALDDVTEAEVADEPEEPEEIVEEEPEGEHEAGHEEEHDAAGEVRAESRPTSRPSAAERIRRAIGETRRGAETETAEMEQAEMTRLRDEVRALREEIGELKALVRRLNRNR